MPRPRRRNPRPLPMSLSSITRATGSQAPDLADRVVSSLRTTIPDDYPWPGNVRELEQAVRRILLTGHYEGVTTEAGRDAETSLATEIRDGSLTATDLLSRYCTALYARMGSYEQVARHIDLDRRTVKKYIERDAE